MKGEVLCHAEVACAMHRGQACFKASSFTINPCSLCHRVCFPVILPLIFVALTLIVRGLCEGAIYLMTDFEWWCLERDATYACEDAVMALCRFLGVWFTLSYCSGSAVGGQNSHCHAKDMGYLGQFQHSCMSSCTNCWRALRTGAQDSPLGVAQISICRLKPGSSWKHFVDQLL